jgi:hypothetical protein
MAVAHDGQANGVINFESGTTITGKTTAGSNRFGVVAIAAFPENFTTPTITWGGASMTLITERSDVLGFGLKVQLWGIVNPATASSDIVITEGATGVDYGAAIASSYTGVEQASVAAAIRGTQGATIAAVPTNGPATLTISSAVDDMVVDCYGYFGNAFVVGAGQTEVGNDGNPGTAAGAVSSYEAGASNVTMSWTYAPDYGSQDWVGIAASIKPVSAGGGTAQAPRKARMRMGVGA